MSIVRVPFSLTGGGAASYVPAGAILLDGSADFFDIELGASGSTTKITVSMGIKLAGAISGNNSQVLYAGAGGVGTNGDVIYYFGSGHGTHPNEIGIALDGGSTCVAYLPGKFRDPTAHFRLTVAIDLGQSTDATKVKAWINDESQTLTFSTSCSETAFKFFLQSGTSGGGTISQSIGGWDYLAGYWFGGILSDCVIVANQQLDDTYFVTRDENNGIALVDPTAAVALGGTATTWLRFADSADLGYNENQTTGDWTLNSITSANSTNDNPADDADNDVGNYATWNPLFINQYMDSPATNTYTNANLTYTGGDSGGGGNPVSTIPMDLSVSWYIEVTYDTVGGGTQYVGIHFNPTTTSGPSGGISYEDTGNKNVLGTSSAYGATYTSGDVIGIYYDSNNDQISFYKNGSSQGVAASSVSANGSRAFVYAFFGGNTDKVTLNAGQNTFTGTPPTGAKKLHTANLPAPTVTDPSAYLSIGTHTGSGSTDSYDSGLDSIGLLIAKRYDGAAGWEWFDAVRGANSLIQSNNSDTAVTKTGFSFSGGIFNFDNTANLGQSGTNHVVYTLKANGAGSSNTDGSITSTVSAAAHGGFSIGTYTGTGSAATVGHGLSRAPEWVIVKMIAGTGVQNWTVFQKDIFDGASNAYIILNLPDASTSGASFSSTAPTASVFSVGNDATNQSSSTFVFYAFAKTPGLIASGKYTGNGSTDGPYVVVDDGGSGFRPAFVLIKNSSNATGYDWQIVNATRDPYNPVNKNLSPNLSTAEGSGLNIDFTANGFKLRVSSNSVNASGNTYIYLAFAEYPFGGDGVAQAKAR